MILGKDGPHTRLFEEKKKKKKKKNEIPLYQENRLILYTHNLYRKCP